MKKTISLILVAFCTMGVFAQLAQKVKDENVVLGSITKDGKEIEGYIKRLYEVVSDDKGAVFNAPWNYQSDIKFIPKDVFENTVKLKNKMFTTYGPKDIQGYKYESFVYVSLKFQDLSAVGMGLIPKMTFLRQYVAGKISVYQHFSSPPPVVVNESFTPYYVDCNVPLYVYTKGDEQKTHGVNELNIEKDLADCPYVTEKQAKGEYKAVGGAGEASAMSKLINNTLFKVQVRLQAIDDYNANCK